MSKHTNLTLWAHQLLQPQADPNKKPEVKAQCLLVQNEEGRRADLGGGGGAVGQCMSNAEETGRERSGALWPSEKETDSQRRGFWTCQQARAGIGCSGSNRNSASGIPNI